MPVAGRRLPRLADCRGRRADFAVSEYCAALRVPSDQRSALPAVRRNARLCRPAAWRYFRSMAGQSRLTALAGCGGDALDPAARRGAVGPAPWRPTRMVVGMDRQWRNTRGGLGPASDRLALIRSFSKHLYWIPIMTPAAFIVYRHRDQIIVESCIFPKLERKKSSESANDNYRQTDEADD